MRDYRKQKRSYTLSPHSIAFLERLRRKRKAPSCSMVLDDLISEAEKLQRRAALHQAMDDYYNSLSDEEVADDRAWGEFALEQAAKSRNWA